MLDIFTTIIKRQVPVAESSISDGRRTNGHVMGIPCCRRARAKSGCMQYWTTDKLLQPPLPSMCDRPYSQRERGLGTRTSRQNGCVSPSRPVLPVFISSRSEQNTEESSAKSACHKGWLAFIQYLKRFSFYLLPPSDLCLTLHMMCSQA